MYLVELFKKRAAARSTRWPVVLSAGFQPFVCFQGSPTSDQMEE